MSNLAASFVQRVNNFVGGISPKSPSLPSDAELEAEAERERDRSRRDAEAILSREARERKLVEDRVLEMLESTKTLPPPPRSQTFPNPPSPANSSKDVHWWQAAKNRLTPTKDPLTPAQQVIQDTKSKEKEQRRLSKFREKELQKAKENEWPAKPESKYADPAFANLHIPVAPSARKPVPPSPSSPTPSRPSLSNMPPNLTPSPMRTIDTLSSSPSREAPPLYAHFNAQGTLDIPSTLLAIAKRFEKLEKWTVGHVRALEDRMNDVERWLVDKEKEKQETTSVKESSSQEDVHQELHDVRDEIAELQGRVGELGREMAKLATSTSNLSSGPTSQMASVIHAAGPSTSSVLVQQHTGSSIFSTPHTRLSSSTARDSTSPPMLSFKRNPSGTKFSYPQGDYTLPPVSFSPPSSPQNSLGASTRTNPHTGSGLPSIGGTTSASSVLKSQSSFGMLRTSSPISASAPTTSSPSQSGNALPPPHRAASPRQSSVSPTPRKRYTVALGDRIVARSPSPDDMSSNANPDPPKRTGTPKSFARSTSSIEATFFSNGNGENVDGDSDESEFGEETIGRSAGSRLTSSATFSSAKGDYKSEESGYSPLSNRRLRTQSYGPSTASGSTGSGSASLPTIEPLKPKLRSKSTDRLTPSSSFSSLRGSGTGDGMVSALGGSTKFVDPLVLRRQSREILKPIAMPRPLSGKIAVEKLVAFFDGDKK